MISIIIPVYNAENYLSECLNSLIKQPYHNLEIILINDGSIDNSLKIGLNFASKDNRIKIFNQENKGQAAARNKGLEIAAGEYIVFVDADDTISDDLFTENIKILEQDDLIDFLQFPRHINFGAKNAQLITTTRPIEILKKDLYKSWLEDKTISWFIWDKIYKKEIFSYLRFPEGMIYEDNYLIADVLEITNKVFISKIGTYYYWLRSNSTTTSTHNLKKDVDTQKVNLHILSKIKSSKKLTKARTVILSRIFYVYISLKHNFNYNFEIDILFKEQFHKTPIIDFLRSGLPLKQIVKLAYVKLVGLSYYLKIK